MTHRFRFAALVAFGVLVAIGSPALAQETTGSIAGTIEDTSRSVLPGVTVTVASPSLIGTKTTVTNERGEYTLRLLPPGAYSLRAELSGLGTIVRPEIEVRVGQTATVNLQMAVGSVSETMEVKAEAPIIDARSTTRNFTLDSQAIALIPLGISQHYNDLWAVAPGVADTAATFPDRQPSVNGAAITQNKVYVDGIDAGDHVNAGTTTNLNHAVIQEVGISTGGFEAQAGFGTGGRMNIVTRSGGNSYRGGASFFLTPKRWNDTNLPGAAPANIETYYPEVHVGGPIRRDRLWFFASDKYLYENEGIFNVNDYRSKETSHEFYAKLTYQPAQRHRLMYTYQRDRKKDDPSFGTASFTYDATPVGKFGGYMTGVNWDYQVGPKGLLNVLVSYFDKPNETNGRNGGAPRVQFANAAGAVHTTDGNYDRDQVNEQTRPYVSASYTQSAVLAGSHSFRLSTELYPRTRRLNKLRMNGVEIYRDSPVYGPRQLWRVNTPRPLDTVENDTTDRAYAFAVHDEWRPTRRLTVNGGFRYESNRTSIEGREEPLLDFDSWSPRAGVAYQIDDNTVVKTSISRIGEKFALDFAFSFFPNAVVFDTATSSQVNGVLDTFTQGAPTAATTIRNVSRPVPSVVEYVASIQRQFPGKVAVDVSFVQRRFGHFAESVDRNLILDIPSKRFVGRVDPAFDALIDVVDTERVDRAYRSIQVWANRRLADRWQFNGTYTYAITTEKGEFGYYSTANAARQFAYGERAAEFFETETGSRHNVKLSGSYTLPFDIVAGVYYSVYSDRVLLDTHQEFPAGTLAPRITLSNGRVVADPLFNPVLLVAPPTEEVGRKIGGTHLVNFQLQKALRVGRQQFRVTAMAFNMPNRGERLGYASTLVGHPNYNVLTSVQRPRAGQLSVGWEF